MIDWCVFAFIYLLGLGITLRFALTSDLRYDFYAEYLVYLDAEEKGEWMQWDSILGSCD